MAQGGSKMAQDGPAATTATSATTTTRAADARTDAIMFSVSLVAGGEHITSAGAPEGLHLVKLLLTCVLLSLVCMCTQHAACIMY